MMNGGVFRVQAEVETVHWWHRARCEILLALADEALSGSREAFVLDFGCATGGTTAELAKRYSRCIGIDPSEVAIQLARTRFAGVRFVCGGSRDETVQELLPSADLVVLADVLEHVAADHALLHDLVTRMHPGAQLMLTVPADGRLWSAHDESHGHFRRYDRLSFQSTWSKLPVHPRLVSYFNARLYFAVRIVRAANRFLDRTSGAARTDLKLPPRWLNEALRLVFVGERTRLIRVLRGDKIRAYRHGVSLIALLCREADGGTSIKQHAARASHE